MQWSLPFCWFERRKSVTYWRGSVISKLSWPYFGLLSQYLFKNWVQARNSRHGRFQDRHLSWSILNKKDKCWPVDRYFRCFVLFMIQRELIEIMICIGPIHKFLFRMKKRAIFKLFYWFWIIIIIIIIIIISIIISFMQGIYTFIPETNFVPREYVLQLFCCYYSWCLYR